MNQTRLRITTALASFALLGGAANAAYQFILSGDPVAAASAGSHAAASSGTALVTATCSAPASATPLEARFRTIDESDGIALRSDKPLATILYVR